MIACVDDREKTACAFHLQAREASIAVSDKAMITMTITVGVAVDADGRNSPPHFPLFPKPSHSYASMLHAGSHLHDNYQTSVRVSWCLCVHTKPPGLCGRHGNPPLMECCVVCVPYVLTFCETRAHDAGNVSAEPRATLVMLVGVMHGGTRPDAVSCAMQV